MRNHLKCCLVMCDIHCCHGNAFFKNTGLLQFIYKMHIMPNFCVKLVSNRNFDHKVVIGVLQNPSKDKELTFYFNLIQARLFYRLKVQGESGSLGTTPPPPLYDLRNH